jgi:nicotinamidase-related amidase
VLAQPRHAIRSQTLIQQFTSNTALVLIDPQQGVNDLRHFGGPTGRRNNPEAENKMQTLLTVWRARQQTVVFTQHDSRQRVSPLKASAASGAFMRGLEPRPGDLVIRKDVNSAFIGTKLELELRRRAITRLVVMGFYTNSSVESTVRMAGNMGFDTYLAHDCCATVNTVAPDGRDHDPRLMHDISVAAMHGEFCTALAATDVHRLLSQSCVDLQRVQRNE